MIPLKAWCMAPTRRSARASRPGVGVIVGGIQSRGKIFVKRPDVFLRNQYAGQVEARFRHGGTEQSVRHDLRLELKSLSTVRPDQERMLDMKRIQPADRLAVHEEECFAA